MYLLAKMTAVRREAKPTSLGKSLTLASATAAIALMGMVPDAQAATFDLTFTGLDTTATGIGTVTIDDSLLIPNQALSGFTAGINAFEANFTNIPTTPSSTTFGLANVAGFNLKTDASSNITDFNIASASNVDFDAIGVAPFRFVLSDDGAFDDNIEIGLTPASAPEPLTLLGAATAIGFGAALKRKQKA